MKGKTTICLRLSESENVVVTVSDVIGRELIQSGIPVRTGHPYLQLLYLAGKASIFLLPVQMSKAGR